MTQMQRSGPLWKAPLSRELVAADPGRGGIDISPCRAALSDGTADGAPQG